MSCLIEHHRHSGFVRNDVGIFRTARLLQDNEVGRRARGIRGEEFEALGPVVVDIKSALFVSETVLGVVSELFSF